MNEFDKEFKFANQILEICVTSKKNLVVGVSGGADSMALLHFLINFSILKKEQVIVAHINHMLRGAEALRDQKLVESFCVENGVKFELLAKDIAVFAKEQKIGQEECGRITRYDFFESLAKKYDANIATAHTLSDSTETMLFNLTRGTGPHGLFGVPAKRGKIFRPILKFKREQIEKYCKIHNVPFIIDSSNLKLDYNRNKIRLKVMPILKRINPKVEEAFGRTAQILKTDCEYLDFLAKENFSKIKLDKNIYDVKKLKEMHFSLKTRCIILILSEYTKRVPEEKHMDLILNILEKNKGKLQLFENIELYLDEKSLKIQQKTEIQEEINNWQTKSILGNINTPWGANFVIEKIKAEIFFKKIDMRKKYFNNILDYDKLKGDILFRNRDSGDLFRQNGRNHTKTLKKFFNENKVVPEQRQKTLILASGSQVLWLEGFGSAQICAVCQTTKNLLLIRRV